MDREHTPGERLGWRVQATDRQTLGARRVLDEGRACCAAGVADACCGARASPLRRGFPTNAVGPLARGLQTRTEPPRTENGFTLPAEGLPNAASHPLPAEPRPRSAGQGSDAARGGRHAGRGPGRPLLPRQAGPVPAGHGGRFSSRPFRPKYTSHEARWFPSSGDGANGQQWEGGFSQKRTQRPEGGGPGRGQHATQIHEGPASPDKPLGRVLRGSAWAMRPRQGAPHLRPSAATFRWPAPPSAPATGSISEQGGGRELGMPPLPTRAPSGPAP